MAASASQQDGGPRSAPASVISDAAGSVPMAAWLATVAARVEAHLDTVLETVDAGAAAPAPVLREAMRYAVKAGGKRVRPLLVHAASELGAAPEPRLVDGCATAVELIHTYSLIHDDLPCMDDDALRRGRPTAHRVFGEAQALLAGDALQALAFEVMAAAGSGCGGVTGELVLLLAQTSGAAGMVGGQSIDLDAVGKELDRSQLETMHAMKTAALLRASVLLGGVASGAVGADPARRAALSRFADCIGLAFQMVDDVLDVVADTATLGKTAGKDAANDKPTYVTLLGVAGARAMATNLHQRALAALAPFGAGAARLAGMADLIVNRGS